VHARIGDRVKHALVARHAGDHEPARLQVAQQQVERRRVKARVLRLQHEVVVALRLQQLGDAGGAVAALDGHRDDLSGSRSASGPGCRSRR
jgi:hypothetical protein